jgi:hypothetical protein
MAERQAAKRRAAGKSGVLTTGLIALAAFLVLVLVLTVRLRDSPFTGLTPVKPRIVLARRIHVTTVHKRVIGVARRAGAPAATVSTSSVSGPTTRVANVARVGTRASGGSTR